MTSEPYGEFCALTLASEVLADRWTPLIVRELLAGHTHFNELHRRLPRISRSVLAERLRRLEREGILYRQIGRNGRTSAYLLTPAGREVEQVVNSLREWGTRWVLGEPHPENLDPAVVLWWMRRRIDRTVLPEERVVVEFVFSGVRKERMWLVLTQEDVAVCLHHPGFDEDLIVRADVETMFDIWLGRITLNDAMGAGEVRIEGLPRLARAFTNWVLGSHMVRATETASKAS